MTTHGSSDGGVIQLFSSGKGHTRTLGLVAASDGGDRVKGLGQVAVDAVGLVVLRVNGSDEHVVGDVVKMAAVLEPGAGSADVVGRALALGLDQDVHVLQVLAIPGVKGSEELETVALGVNVNLEVGIASRDLVSVLHNTDEK